MALAAALLLILGGCGGDDPNGDSSGGTANEEASSDGRSPAKVSARAGTATQQARTARIRSEQVTSAQGQELTATLEGTADLETGDSEAELELSLPGQGTQSSQVIIEGSTAYIEAGAFPGAPTDAEWISIDFEVVSAQTGINLEAFRQNGAGELEYLSEVADVEEVGTETVRGVGTTLYRFSTNLAALAESGPEHLRSSYEQMMQITHSDEIPTQVWIDEDDLVRRIVTDLEIEQQGQQFSQRSTIEYYEFGVEVDVQPPPEQDTVDITELGGGGGAP
jgi:hypothetical protein